MQPWSFSSKPVPGHRARDETPCWQTRVSTAASLRAPASTNTSPRKRAPAETKCRLGVVKQTRPWALRPGQHAVMADAGIHLGSPSNAGVLLCHTPRKGSGRDPDEAPRLMQEALGA